MKQCNTRTWAAVRNDNRPFFRAAACVLTFSLMLLHQPIQASLLETSADSSQWQLFKAYKARPGQDKLASPTHTEYENFRVAVLDYFNEEYQSAYKLFRPLAEKGNSSAEYYMALMFDEGRGVKQDASAAVGWYTLAAQQGHMDAQYNLGVAYASGMGVSSDMGQAIAWWKRAAQLGSVDAQFNLGLVYYIGQGNIKVDLNNALSWWQKAAGHGDAVAQYQLGMMYATGKGTQQDLCAAGQLWRYAARQGHDEAIMAYLELNSETSVLSSCRDLRADARN
ncbi:MAG TPA: sel1 repeat family protein [Gammaproteobacteria bacterium]|nr:sel1 repeat family protein [Gammaproteobacteria bacterium]